jgi:hypothetical protein
MHLFAPPTRPGGTGDAMHINYNAEIQRAREELGWLRSRYDCGAVSGTVFAVVKSLECEVSWLQHEQQQRAR